MKNIRLIFAAIVLAISVLSLSATKLQPTELSKLQKENIEALSDSSELGIRLELCYSRDCGKIVSDEAITRVCEKGTVCAILPWGDTNYNGSTVYMCKSYKFVSHMMYRRGHCYVNVK